MGAVIGRFRPECQVRMQREINNYAGGLAIIGFPEKSGISTRISQCLPRREIYNRTNRCLVKVECHCILSYLSRCHFRVITWLVSTASGRGIIVIRDSARACTCAGCPFWLGRPDGGYITSGKLAAMPLIRWELKQRSWQ